MRLLLVDPDAGTSTAGRLASPSIDGYQRHLRLRWNCNRKGFKRSMLELGDKPLPWEPKRVDHRTRTEKGDRRENLNALLALKRFSIPFFQCINERSLPVALVNRGVNWAQNPWVVKDQSRQRPVRHLFIDIDTGHGAPITQAGMSYA
ncbi:hypothetical protein U1Q18_017801 [Sarracenia purpurea var. burkii]